LLPSVRHLFDRELPSCGALTLLRHLIQSLRSAALLCIHTPSLISGVFSMLAGLEIEVNSVDIELGLDAFCINVPWKMSSR